jgi:hypothetical protein
MLLSSEASLVSVARFMPIERMGKHVRSRLRETISSFGRPPWNGALGPSVFIVSRSRSLGRLITSTCNDDHYTSFIIERRTAPTTTMRPPKPPGGGGGYLRPRIPCVNTLVDTSRATQVSCKHADRHADGLPILGLRGDQR